MSEGFRAGRRTPPLPTAIEGGCPWCSCARSHPKEGQRLQRLAHWSLAKLREHLIETGVVESISPETVRKILAERGISFQRTKTWKESTDPGFELKKTAS